MSWFRLHDEVADDPKVQRLSPALFQTWINLLCLASRNKGKLPEIEDVAFTLRVQANEAQERVDSLVSAGLLERNGDSLVPHNWNGRQYKSDVSTERVKRFRKRKGNVSKPLRETDQSRAEQIQSRADTEKPKPPARSASLVFENAYSRYPRQIGKRAAEKAWGSAVDREAKKRVAPLAEHEDFIFQKVMHYGAACTKYHKPREFIPHMATWLNQDRFLDDPSEWEVTTNGNGSGNKRLSEQESRNGTSLAVAAGMGKVFGRADAMGGEHVPAAVAPDPRNTS